jgi:hypothetical protein
VPLAAPHFAPPITTTLSSSPALEHAPTVDTRSPLLLAVAWPPHRIPSSGERPIEFPDPISLSSAPLLTPLSAGVAGRQAPASSGRPSTTGPRPHGPSLQGFPLQKQFQKFVILINLGNFAEKPLGFPKIKLQSMISKLGPWNLKNNFRNVPSSRKIHKIAPETSKLPIFSTTTPNPMILVPKFSESLPISFYAFI